jgi:hypothetical protein
MRHGNRFQPAVVPLETRAVPAAFPMTDDRVVLTPDDGGLPKIKVINPANGEDVGEIQVYDNAFRGGVRVATGDVTGDGVRDIVTAAGPGGGPHVKVYDGATGAVLRSFFAYAPGFRQGITVAVGDVTGDGFADIITGAGPGGGPHIQVFDARTGASVRSFFAYDSGFRGGVNVGSGDINRDGFDDILVGTGTGGGPHVYVRSGKDDSVLTQFFAYDVGFRGGVNVGSGDLDGDGFDDIITGAGIGGGPHARAVSGKTGAVLVSTFVDDLSYRNGVRVAAGDTNHDGRDDLLARTRHGSDVAATIVNPATGGTVSTFIRRVDDHPSADDLIAGESENRHGSDDGTSGGGSGSGGGSSSGGDSGTVTRIEGTIVAVDTAGRTVTLRRGSSTVLIRLTTTAKVERNDIGTTLAAFKVGDFGQARLGSDGLAFKMEAIGA